MEYELITQTYAVEETEEPIELKEPEECEE